MSSRSRAPVVVSRALPLLFIASSVFALPPAHHWSKGIGSPSYDYAQDVATDASGNVIVVGSVQGGTDFGGGVLTPSGSVATYVVKYDASGNHLWSLLSGGTDGVATDVTTDAAGNVYVTGYFQGTIDFGGGSLVTAGSVDIFVAKLSSSGSHVWSKRFGGTSADEGSSLSVDNNSNVFVTGYISGSVSFGGPAVGSSNQDAFLLKLDSSGNHVASAAYASLYAKGMTVDNDAVGNVLLAGHFFGGTINFGGGPLANGGALDIFLAKFANNLTHIWSKGLGGTGSDYGNSVAVTAAGDVYFFGSFMSSVDFGGGALVSAGGNDMVLAKYASNGSHVWSQRFGGPGAEGGYEVSVDNAGRPSIAGNYESTIDFGGGALPTPGAAMGVALFDQSGNHIWSGSYTGASSPQVMGIATDAAGDVLVSGYFSASTNLGDGTLTSAGNTDGFVVKYSGTVVNPVITSINDIGNDQGRKVRIRFERSGWDGSLTTPVTHYEAYRRDDPTPALFARDPAGLSVRELMVNGWTFAGSVPAHAEETYGIDAPTVGDSTLALGQYYSVFYVRAATSSPSVFFDSEPDSGYSRDNLAPGVPLNFIYTAGDLSWTESTAEDFDFFTVYGSNTDAFGAATVVDYSVAPELDVTSSPYAFYYVTATDFSGNEGKPAKVNTLSGVGGAPKSYVLSVSNYPNPFNPRTTVSYTVPSRGTVTISVYDARGAHVATLFNGERGPGAYTIEWDGLANGSAVSSGVYLARIEHSSGTRSKKMVLLK